MSANDDALGGSNGASISSEGGAAGTIEKIDIHRVRMPLDEPWTTAYGSDDAVESVLVSMTVDGVTGWGESTPLCAPTYSPEYAKGVFSVIRDFLAPRLIGRHIESGVALQDSLSCFKGNQFAKAALDLAWWDAHAKRLAQPLWRVLGGKTSTVQVGEDFGVQANIDQLLAEIRLATGRGITRIKLKYRPGWDFPIVAAVRQQFPDLVMHIDCNSGYTLDDLEMFRQLDELNLAMIEQPLAHDDLVDHARLQELIATPICLDESITSFDKARKAIQLNACRWINIKPGRVGGLTEAKRIHDYCEQRDMPCWVGGMLESSLGLSFMVALATLPNMKYPNDILPSSKFYKHDLSTPAVERSGPSCITASTQPGVGCRPDPAQLQRLGLEHVEVSD